MSFRAQRPEFFPRFISLSLLLLLVFCLSIADLFYLTHRLYRIVFLKGGPADPAGGPRPRPRVHSPGFPALYEILSMPLRQTNDLIRPEGAVVEAIHTGELRDVAQDVDYRELML
jgi:hypothetical protein